MVPISRTMNVQQIPEVVQLIQQISICKIRTCNKEKFIIIINLLLLLLPSFQLHNFSLCSAHVYKHSSYFLWTRSKDILQTLLIIHSPLFFFLYDLNIFTLCNGMSNKKDDNKTWQRYQFNWVDNLEKKLVIIFK